MFLEFRRKRGTKLKRKKRGGLKMQSKGRYERCQHLGRCLKLKILNNFNIFLFNFNLKKKKKKKKKDQVILKS